MSLPSILTKNSYNIIGLPSGSTTAEIKKRTLHLINLSKIDESETFPTDFGDVVKHRGELDLKKSLERLTSVEDRLSECFFWFEIITKEDQQAFDALSRRDFKRAIEVWSASGGDNSWIKRKNRALALYVVAVSRPCLDSFKEFSQIWRELRYDDLFWKFYSTHYSLHDDLGTDLNLLKEFRTSLPKKLGSFAVEMFEQTNDPGVIGSFYDAFGEVTGEIEQKIITPILNDVNSLLSQIGTAADGSDSPNSELKTLISRCATEITSRFSSLDKFGISDYMPIKIAKEKCAEGFRSASIALHNIHEDIAGSRSLLEISLSFATSDSHRIQVAKDREQLDKNSAFHEFVEHLSKANENADPEMAYNNFLRIEKTTPASVKAEEIFENVKRRLISEYVLDIFRRAKEHLDKKDEWQAEVLFSVAQAKASEHLEVFALNTSKVLELVDSLAAKTRAVSDPNSLTLVDRSLKDVRETMDQIETDEHSKLIFFLICQSAIYKEISPYIRRVRYGGYLVSLGWWTIYIYGIGAIFWIAGYCYKRKIF